MRIFFLLAATLLSICGQSQNVGIGVASPQKKLHVISADSTTVLLESTDLGSQKSAVGIALRSQANTTFSLMAVGKRPNGYSDTGRLHLYRNLGGKNTLVLSVDEFRRVGIGAGDVDYNRLVRGQLDIDNTTGSTILLLNNVIPDAPGSGYGLEDVITVSRNNKFAFNIKAGLPQLASGSGAEFQVYDPENPFGYTTKLILYNPYTRVLNKLFADKGADVSESLSVKGFLSVTGPIYAGTARPFVDVVVEPRTIREIVCNCPAGTEAIGGGGGHRDYNVAAQDIQINYSGPDQAGNAARWRVIANNTNANEARTVRGYAICSRLQ